MDYRRDVDENLRPGDALRRVVELIEGGVVSEYGHAARGFAEKCGWGDVVDGFEGILEDVI